MNRQQRRAVGKGQPDERLEVANITVTFKNGKYVNLDTSKVQVIDKDTGRSLFEEVLDATPPAIEGKPAYPADDPHPGEATTDAYQVAFDTPEGRMVYAKNGNWSGVRPAKEGE